MKIDDELLDGLADQYLRLRERARLPLRTRKGQAFTFERFLEMVMKHRAQ